MSRTVVARGVALVVVAVGSFGAAGGCAKNESTLFIRQVQVPSDPPDCTLSSEPDSLALLRGTLDVAIRGEYSAALLVGNQLVGRGSQDLVRTETSRVLVNSAEVRILTDVGDVRASYSVPTSGFVDPGEGGVPSFGIVQVPMIDGSTAQGLAAELSQSRQVKRMVSRVRVFGQTLGGTDVESDEFAFPISVCYGCSVVFVPASDSPDVEGQDCGQVTEAESATTTCSPGQDGPIDCRDCLGIAPDICRTR